MNKRLSDRVAANERLRGLDVLTPFLFCLNARWRHRPVVSLGAIVFRMNERRSL